MLDNTTDRNIANLTVTGGNTTLRWVAAKSDIDYLMLVPVGDAPTRPVITEIKLVNDGQQIQGTWTGTGDPSNPVIDYRRVCQVLKVLEAREFDYIEQVASGCMDVLTGSLPGKWKIVVTKKHPPTSLPMAAAQVILEGGEG